MGKNLRLGEIWDRVKKKLLFRGREPLESRNEPRTIEELVAAVRAAAKKKDFDAVSEAVRPLIEATWNERDIIEGIQKLGELFRDKNRNIKLAVVRALEEIAVYGKKEEAIKEAIKGLAKALENKDRFVIYKAILALIDAVENGRDVSEAIPNLPHLLEDRDKYVKEGAIVLLGMVTGYEWLIRRFADALRNEDPTVRGEALMALEKLLRKSAKKQLGSL